VIRYRVRASRDSAEGGVFAWAELNAAGTVLQTGTSDVAPPEPGACELIIPADAVLLQRIRVPAAQRRRLSGNLRFLVEDLVACDAERVHVVEIDVYRDEVCVGIIDRAWLAAVLARLAACGLQAQRALAETLMPAVDPDEWTLIWQAGDAFVRTGAGAGFALDSAEAGGPPVSLRLAVDAAPPARIVVRPAGQALPDMQAWSEALGVPVQSGAPWSWAQASAAGVPDLLQGEFALGRGDDGWRARLRRPALLAASLVVLASAGLAADWALQAAERRALLAEMRSLYRETFGASAVVVDPPLQMQRGLAELKQRNGEPAPTDFLALLNVARDKLLDPARQRVQAISYQNGRLAVALAPHDPAGFGALVEELRAKASIPGHEVRIETGDAKGAAQVRVILNVESGRWALAKP
jgi:general secretion pathway protein L